MEQSGYISEWQNLLLTLIIVFDTFLEAGGLFMKKKRYRSFLAAVLAGTFAVGCLTGCGKMDEAAGGKMTAVTLMKSPIPFSMPRNMQRLNLVILKKKVLT